jgi:hypothetical protein
MLVHQRRGVVWPVVPVVLAVLSAAAAAFAGCNDVEVPHACSDIPPGGCPRSHGVACEDPACEAVYLCRPNNVWELEERCPAHDAAPRIETPVSDAAVDSGVGDSTPRDASVDAPPGAYGGPGCLTLQAPDCALGVALSCGAGCCGCEDLFVCDNLGWTLAGACVDGVIR